MVLDREKNYGEMGSDSIRRRTSKKISPSQVINEIDNRWSPISTMPSPRYHFGAAALNGEIYIVGGWLEFKMKLKFTMKLIRGVGEDFTSVYSPTTDTWRTVGDMKIPRYGRWDN